MSLCSLHEGRECASLRFFFVAAGLTTPLQKAIHILFDFSLGQVVVGNTFFLVV